MTPLRGLRGATTIDRDDVDALRAGVHELLLEMVQRNDLELDDVASILFTATDDIHSEFPAKVAREVNGFADIPMICAQELDIRGATPLCIRVLIHVSTDSTVLRHVYQHGASGLRPDLAN